MILHIQESLKRHQINLENQTVVVGVSTGVDSMTLLHCLQKLDVSFRIVVCHVNHGKRAESFEEEAFIRQYGLDYNIRVYCKHLKEELNIVHNFQEEARNRRLQFFYDVMEKEKASILMLAHHLTDDVETSVMRILRGSHLKGYAGIEECYTQNGFTILRPLLRVTKKEILQFAKDQKIAYYEDKSNSEPIYTRNRVRHNIVGELFKENPQFDEKFLEFKETLLAASTVIEEARDQIIAKLITRNEDHLLFDQSQFLKCTPFFQVEVLFEILKEHRLGKQNIQEIIKLISTEKQNLKTIYKTMTFVKEYNEIKIFNRPIEEVPVYIEIDQLGVYPVNEKVEIHVTKKSNIFITNFTKLWYNSSQLPVIVRSRREGDKITLEYGTKKVNKLLIDEKVGILKRNDVLILEKDQEILAVFGYEKSAKLKTLKDCDVLIELKEKQNDNTSIY